MVETIFTSALFVETVLPFLLMFTIIFAILQKTEILGKEKKQVDALVSLVIALIFVAFGSATDIVVRMIPILGVALVVILVFMILFGSIYKPGAFEISDKLKAVFGVLIGLVVLVTVLVLTGGFDYILGFVTGEGNSSVITNVIIFAVILGAIVAVVVGSKKESGGSGKKD